MENELEETETRICPLCNSPFTVIRIGKRKLRFWVHTGSQLDVCEAIADDHKWLQRCQVALELIKKKHEKLGLVYNKEGLPKIFGEIE